MKAIGLAIAGTAMLCAGSSVSADAVKSVGPSHVAAANAKPEIFYQIFMRSFRDSNGDRIGDLRGLTAKLGYLKRLKVTAILLTPLQASPFYHNYFATDFKRVDPAFGSMEDYLAFVRAAHAQGLKVYLDEEVQYVAEGHPWLDKARGNPNLPFSNYVLWNKPGNEDPEPFMNQPSWLSYSGRYIGIAMVDLRNPKVVDYFRDLFLFWTDPHGDGSLRDGVDGFRIDHMMDDLDNKHRLTDLFAHFWRPIFTAVRERNPKVRILAEQSDWGFGEDWLRRGGADAVFAFPLRGSLTKLDKAELIKAIRDTEAKTPLGKDQIVFIENHDTDRYMSTVNDQQRARIGAAFNILLKGEPLIYYGQELGMRGKVTTSALSDAAHIPLREAFRWRKDQNAKGSAIWYRGDKPWWRGRYNRSGDGVSVEEEAQDPSSLLTWYKRLIALRSERTEIQTGSQRILCDDSTGMVCILRQEGASRTLLIVNLGHRVDSPSLPADVVSGRWSDLLTGSQIRLGELTIAPNEVRIVGTPIRR
ncbi:MAG TPA: alpha-amylase family glycosyl hydrolase [Sphingomicrobium sp.]|nr:alpha-amylase family glycosyl hydrolase [Sphingomicrobium sp.]